MEKLAQQVEVLILLDNFSPHLTPLMFKNKPWVG